MVRKPVEVASSLAVRDKLPVPLGLALWNAYSRHLAVGLCRAADNRRRLFGADRRCRRGFERSDRCAHGTGCPRNARSRGCRCCHRAGVASRDPPSGARASGGAGVASRRRVAKWVFEPVHVMDRLDIAPSPPQPPKLPCSSSSGTSVPGSDREGDINGGYRFVACFTDRRPFARVRRHRLAESDPDAVGHQGVDPVVRPGTGAPALAAEQSAVALELRMRAVEIELRSGRSRRRSPPFRAVTALLRRLTRPDNPLFDPVWYRSTYPDVKASDAYGHYLIHGVAEGRDPNPLFDTSWYVERNPDIASKRLTPLDHFLFHGALEGRDPGPAFDSAWYLTENPDVAAAGMNPLLHYFRTGAREGRAPRPGYSGEPVTSPGIASAAATPPQRGLIARSIRIAQQSTRQSLRLIRIAATKG